MSRDDDAVKFCRLKVSHLIDGVFYFHSKPATRKDTKGARFHYKNFQTHFFVILCHDSHVRPDFPPDHRPAHRALTDGRRAVDACADVAARVEQHGGVQVQAYLALPGLAKGLELHHKKTISET